MSIEFKNIHLCTVGAHEMVACVQHSKVGVSLEGISADSTLVVDIFLNRFETLLGLDNFSRIFALKFLVVGPSSIT